jgi:hypothetical protein
VAKGTAAGVLKTNMKACKDLCQKRQVPHAEPTQSINCHIILGKSSTATMVLAAAHQAQTSQTAATPTAVRLQASPLLTVRRGIFCTVAFVLLSQDSAMAAANE